MSNKLNRLALHVGKLANKYGAVKGLGTENISPIDQEFLENIRHLNTLERRVLAGRLARRLDALLASIAGPPGKTPDPVGKTPRGFFMVNIAKYRLDELRALCECADMDLHRLFTGFAKVSSIRELELDTGLTAEKAITMSRSARKSYGKRRRKMIFSTRIHYSDSKN